ncbi:MAG: hypothetical protein VXZ72_03925, partial [Chlamydiota bacterium]|nr:hypothetical protein [Chlamydiota bacterium]
GQYSNPLKYSDVPAQTRQRYRKLSTKDLGRLVDRAGGATTPKGRIYSAVLEERSVNPMMAGKNPELAKASPYSVYKTAQHHAVVDHLNKIAAVTVGQGPYQNPDRMYGQKLPNMTNIDNRLGAASGGAAVGAGLGGLSGLAFGKGIAGRGMAAGIGIMAGGALGSIYGAVKKPVKNINEV